MDGIPEMSTKALREPQTGTVGFDPARLNGYEQYKLLGGAVIPRPLGLVTTLGAAGPNAAPFSYFMAVSQDPPMVLFSIGAKEEEGEFSIGEPAEGEKDTLLNIRESSEFVVHIVSDAIKEKMNVCAIQFARGVNEIERAGFRTAPSIKVRPPRIIDSPVQFECTVHQIIPLGRVPYHVVIGEVVYMHFAEGLVDDKLRLDWRKLNPIARLARPGTYLRITDNFSMRLPRDLGMKS